MKHIYTFLFIIVNVSYCITQTTIWQQGFENATLNCTENWGYTGGVRNTLTARTGTNSLRIGRSGESNTVTFNSVDVSGMTGLKLQLFHRVLNGSGPGMDTREGAIICVSLNGGAYSIIGKVGGASDHNYLWTATSGGVTNTCPQTFTTPNPLDYTIPAGTNTIQLKVMSIGRNSSNCTVFNTAMNQTATAYNYDRPDEGFYIDDVKITTTSTLISGIWTGATSTDWHDCTNWHNRMVPTANTNVIINQTAIRNCEVYNGNAVCNSLKLESNNGTTNDLYVRGARTLTVNTNLEINKTANSGNLDIDIYAGGHLNVSGNITVSRSGGTGMARVRMLNSGTAGTLTCTNFTLQGAAMNDESAELKHDNTPNALVYVNGNIIIKHGGTIDCSNGGDPTHNAKIYVRGNWESMSSETDFKQTGSTIIFDGTGNQFITTNSFNEVFWNIQVNKNSGTLSLNNNIEIENNVNYTKGIMNSFSSALLIFRDNATHSNCANISHTNGPVRKIGNDVFIFPVGNGTYFREARISAPGNTTDHFTTQYYLVNPNTPGYNINNKEASLHHISTCEYWMINRTNGTSNVLVTLSWNFNTSCGVENLSDLRVARWGNIVDAGAVLWRNHGNGGTTGNTSYGTVVSSAAVTRFSPFTLASSSALNPLPITLVDFEINCQTNNSIIANWTTLSERDNASFVLEFSENGQQFNPVLETKGAGNSNSELKYEEHLNLSQNGYFRLKQTDFNGQFSYSNIVQTNCDENIISLYPNPTVGVLNLKGIEKGTEITIFNTNGKLVKTLIHSDDLIDISDLPSGLYLLQVLDSTDTPKTIKLQLTH